MSSTYSSSLRLELMGTGDQSGTWGTVNNRNLGTLLEDAISNFSANVTAGNVTLTTVNGNSDQARMSTIIVTGNPGTSRYVIAPAVNKLYWVHNTSDSDVYISTAASGGVQIGAGYTAKVYYNGSAFVRLAGTFVDGFKSTGAVIGSQVTATSLMTAQGGSGLGFTGTSALGMVVQGATSSTDHSGVDFKTNAAVTPLARIAAKFGLSGSYLYFGTSNNYVSGITNTAFQVDPSGYVSFGTTDATHRVNVNGHMSMLYGSMVAFRDNLNTLTNSATMSITSSNDLIWYTAGGAKFMLLATTGALGVGVTPSTHQMEVAGQTTYGANVFKLDGSATGSALVNSDFRVNATSGRIQYDSTNKLFSIFPYTTNSTHYLAVGETAVAPSPDNYVQLGSGSYRWTAVYATNGTIQTSDMRLKTDIHDSDLGLAFIDKLRPVRYRWKEGGVTRYGFLAQEVEQALNGREFDGLANDDNGYAGLNYAEFVAPTVAAIKEIHGRLLRAEQLLGLV